MPEPPPPSLPALLPQPSPLAEAKARFSASWDLVQRQQQQEAVPQIEQVGLPSPPGFRGLADRRQPRMHCPPGPGPPRSVRIRRGYTARVIGNPDRRLPAVPADRLDRRQHT